MQVSEQALTYELVGLRDVALQDRDALDNPVHVAERKSAPDRIACVKLAAVKSVSSKTV